MRTILLLLISATVFASAVPNAWSLSFNPEDIIPDADFFHHEDMSRAEVQSFLERKQSTLATYTVVTHRGENKRASDVIWESATTNGLNPKVLLVLLQKEQSLIENQHPTPYNYDWATGFARCDSCAPTDPAIAAYKGFATQVEKAAWRSKYYITNANEFNYRAGAQAIVDGVSLIPRNNATAALYNYTPHLRGNFSFWKLWQSYFGKVFPDGMLVKENESSDIWLIQDGKKRKITSMSVLRSRFSEKNLVTVTRGSLDTYTEGMPLRFMQYSLLQVPSGGVFLIADDGKYIIPSRDVFRSIGFNPDEIVRVNDHDLDEIPTKGILSKKQSPMEELVQDVRTGGVFALSGGIKRPLLERALLQANFARMPIRPDRKGALDAVPLGAPMLFSDGSLIKSDGDPTVYIISHGQKRQFVSEEAFTALGFSWNQVMSTTGATLALHPLGAPVDIGRIIEQEYTDPTTGIAQTGTLNPVP
ncbi:hypothetical protein HY623_02070 [Candidatus Uhrbacteria bacterium]|nr:hypothetical protein [Candidatus Uhrbacteria bacterium]